MSHFAKLDENNVVTFVTVGRQEDDGLEAELNARTGDIYRQTSYNTHGGVHYTGSVPSTDQSKAFRFNYAGKGYTYDSGRDAFISPKPYESWVLDEASRLWAAPVERPTGDGMYEWDEDSLLWVEVEEPIIP